MKHISTHATQAFHKNMGAHEICVRVSLYVGIRRYASAYLSYHTHSRAWASQHHADPSRVHRGHSAFPLSRRTHPHAGEGLMGSADHLQSPLLLVCARTPPSAEVLGLCHHPTARAHTNCSNPEIHINLSILKLLTTAITLKAIHEFQKSFKETPPYTERYHYARLLTHIA